MIALYRYIWVETDGKPRRVLATDPERTFPSLDAFGEFQRELRGVAELAVVSEGRVLFYV